MMGVIRKVGWAFLPALAAVLCYLPALGNDWAWDDRQRILEALPIRSFSAESLKWMFTTLSGSYWMPLTWISVALDWKLGGGNPFVFHLNNVLLHAANSVLVYYLANRVFGMNKVHPNLDPSPLAGEGRGEGAALLAALLFAVHPLHVESVAWAAERKDVLYAFFYLSAILLYINYARTTGGRSGRYAGVLALFALSLMSKPMAVTLPAVLLVLDFWPLGRRAEGWKRLVLEKVPMFLMAAAVAWITTQAPAHTRSAALVGELSLPFRLSVAARGLGFYLLRTFLPVDLSPLYPIPPRPGVDWWIGAGLSSMFWIVAAAAAWRWRGSRPWFGATIAVYGLSLSPVLGLVQAGSHAAADRFMYLPILAVLLPLTFGATRLGARRPRFWAALGAAAVVALGAGTMRQCRVWKDSISVYERIVTLHPGQSNLAHANLAAAYAEAGRLPEALAQYEMAEGIPPLRAQARASAGKAAVLADLGRVEEARRALEAALAMDPGCTQAIRNLWVLNGRLGRYDEALVWIRRAAALEPGNPENIEKEAILLEQMGRWAQAAAGYARCGELEPGKALHAVREGVNRMRMGDAAGARSAFERAYRLEPGRAELIPLIEKAKEAARNGNGNQERGMGN